jgi:hypothetical protein
MNEHDQHNLCGAKTRAGTPCKRAPVRGRNRCNLHGGKTPRGAALPQFKDGQYSNILPVRLAARYEELIRDPEILRVRDDIALVVARVHELLSQLGEEPSDDDRTIWSEILDGMEQHRKLIETERKTLISMRLMISAEELTTFLSAFLMESRNAITSNVTDPDDQRRTIAAIQESAAKYIRD